MKKRHPKNIIVSHVYSADNKGDAALTSVLISDLKHTYPTANIRILKLESSTQGGTFEGIPELPSFMFYALNKHKNPLTKLIYTLYMFALTIAWALWYRFCNQELPLNYELKEIMRMYASADLVVAVGGGYIRSRRGLVNMLNIPLIMHPLLIGAILGAPTILYSQSIGPFLHFYEPWLVAPILRKMSLILVREDTSLKLLEKMKVTQNVERAVDAGFLLKTDKKTDLRKLYSISDGKVIIGVTVRSWLDKHGQQNYERAIAEALDSFIEKHAAHVVFIPQVTAQKGDDDRTVSKRVYSAMKHKGSATVIKKRVDHFEIKSLYDNLDLLLGTRFHSVIFSLTSFVPVLAIEYEHKTSGIMRDLKLDNWVIKIEDVRANLITEELNKLIKNRSAYRENLKKTVPPYIKKAEQTIEHIESRRPLKSIPSTDVQTIEL